MLELGGWEGRNCRLVPSQALGLRILERKVSLYDQQGRLLNISNVFTDVLRLDRRGLSGHPVIPTLSMFWTSLERRCERKTYIAFSGRFEKWIALSDSDWRNSERE